MESARPHTAVQPDRGAFVLAFNLAARRDT